MALERINSKVLERYRAQAIADEKDVFVWDTSLQGFGAKCTSKGRVSWLVQKWIGGREGKAKRIVIGSHPLMSIDKAKDEAGKLIGDVRNGVELPDRKTRLRKARQAINAAPLNEVIDLYVLRNGKPGRYWDELKPAMHRELCETFGKDTAVEKLTKADIRHLIETKQDKQQHGAARLLYAQLRPFFRWCVERELIPVSPMEGLSAPKPVKARDRVLTDDEIKAFWKATESLGWPFGPFYQMLLLTAQRREEVAGMLRHEVHANGEWTIPAERTKNGKAHVVHLPVQAMRLLSSIEYKGQMVFSTTGHTALSGYSKGKTRLDAHMLKIMREASGNEDQTLDPFRIHDLRRTAASGMAGLGFAPHVIERVLNHVSGAQGGLVGVYQRFEYQEERKRALAAWGQHVEGLVSAENKPNKVLSFAKQRRNP